MKSSTLKIALCGVLAALSIVLLFLASLSGIGTFAGPVLASCIILITSIEFGKSAALTIYITVAILSIIIMPDRELAAFYVCFAWYPIITDVVNKRFRPFLRVIANLVIYSLSILVFLYIARLLTGIPFGEGELSSLILRILFFAGAFTFLLLGKVYEKVELLWKIKLRKILLPK